MIERKKERKKERKRERKKERKKEDIMYIEIPYILFLSSFHMWGCQNFVQKFY